MVVLDACVLYPAPLRDVLLQLASAGSFKARWSDAIHEEWISNLLQQRPDLSRIKLERTRSLMNAAILDCLVTGYEDLVPDLDLPDANDRHVLAAAIHCGAGWIVTFNLKDFPPDKLALKRIAPIHPDDFVARQIDADQAAVLESLRRCRLRLKAPPLAPVDFLAALERCGLPRSVGRLKASLDFI